MVWAFGCKLPLLIAILALTGIVPALIGVPALAQDLDKGKSGAQLFAATCAGCHHSPRGLAKDRYSWTLSSFLQQHYTSSSASAQMLTAYLQSVDAARPNGSAAAAKSRAPAANISTSSPSMSAPLLRPPAEIPAH